MERMKALKSFRVGASTMAVSPGNEFECSETSARSYEARGMAVRVRQIVQTRKDTAKTVKNEAAEAGPLASPGGATGAETSQSLSQAARAPRKPRSRHAEGELDL